MIRLPNFDKPYSSKGKKTGHFQHQLSLIQKHQDSQDKVAREMDVTIEEMTNMLEHLKIDLQLQKARLKKELINWKLLLQ